MRWPIEQFTIQTDKPKVEVSWQVTGIRQDAWANAHRIPVEVAEAERAIGDFICTPNSFGAPAEKSTSPWHTTPCMQKMMKEAASK